VIDLKTPEGRGCGSFWTPPSRLIEELGEKGYMRIKSLKEMVDRGIHSSARRDGTGRANSGIGYECRAST